LTQRAEAGTAKTARKDDAKGRSQNYWEQPELPRTVETAVKADAEGRS